ncbi:carbon storage regulator [Zavarzinella formosa]|uniref:carbon storage regulator n=1 Tax=Zavarzinella formosa TaxID=360055 RepID=UPI00030E59D2|nr:carbon storage regulator [Zavarzinella formosa]
MLVLTRKLNEEIIIGDNIRIKIVAVNGDRIRVGIEAPRDVAVNRAELQARKTNSPLTPVLAGRCEESVDLGASPVPSDADTAH